MPRNDIEHAVQACFETFYNKRSDFSIDQNVHAVLGKLCKYIPLVAITNGNVNCEQIGITQYFSHILQANQTQKMKPYPDMFHRASELLSIPLMRILHVGDNGEKDVWGANRCGMYSAWYAYDRPMHIRQETMLSLPHIQLDSLEEILTILKL